MLPLILCSLLAPPPDVTHAIDQLGSDSWLAREAAHARLHAMGERALPALRAATSSPDAEIAARARDLIADDEARFLDSLTTVHGGTWPCLDCLCWHGCYREECDWRSVVEHYRPYFGGCQPEYPGYRAATVALVLDLRRAGYPDCSLRGLVRRMVEIERRIPITSGGRMAERIAAPEGGDE